MNDIEQELQDSQVVADHEPLTLDLLLEEVCHEKLHAEIDTGTPVGAEAWADVPVDAGDADPPGPDYLLPAST